MFQSYRESKQIKIDLSEKVNVGETLVNYSTKDSSIDSYCVRLENDSYDRQQWSVYELDRNSSRIIRTYHAEHVEMIFNAGSNEILGKEKTKELVKRLDEIHQYQNWVDDFWNRYKYLRSCQDW